jgi:hypothetical protein
MLTSWRLVLKHHRFEVGSAALAGLAVAAAALYVAWRLTSIGVPAGCFERWLAGGPDGAGACAAPVRAFAEINEEWGGKLFTGLAVLPLVGLLAGVSIVGRELEGRTAQTAWAISPSRRRWLARQMVPIGLIVLVTTALAAAAGTVLETVRLPWYHSAFSDFYLHGLPVVGRMVAAFAVGLLAGASLGRVLPALIVGVVVGIGLFNVATGMHYDWIKSQSVAIALADTGAPYEFDGILFDVRFQTPDGQLLPFDSAGAPSTRDPVEWAVEAHPDWTVVQVGVPASRAPELAVLDAGGFAVLGLIGLAAAVPVVDRRRPM